MYTNNSKQEFIIMAQVLKEEVRNRIIASAKKELLKKGYKDASMREIAKGADLTVGNLYRYFDSKEELVNTIIGTTLEKIDRFVKEKTNEGISLNKSDFSLDVSGKIIAYMLKDIGDELVEIYFESPSAMQILMKDEAVSKRMRKWLSKLITYFVSKMYGDSLLSAKVLDVLSDSFALSIISGIQACFLYKDLNKKELKLCIRAYLGTFAFLLDQKIELGEE